MKLIKSFEKENLTNRIDDNKDYLLPIVVLGTGIFLVIFFILPQLLSFPAKLSQRNEEVARLKEIKVAKEILSRVNEDELNSQVESVSNALPTERNFEGVFNAIATAANASNTQISGYIFNEANQIGTEEAQSQVSRNLTFTITINGTPDQAALFLEELYKTGPIAGVKKIDYSDGETKMEIDFFYKPFTSLDQNSYLPKELTLEQQKILDEINSFTESISEPVTDIPQATTSALPSEN